MSLYRLFSLLLVFCVVSCSLAKEPTKLEPSGACAYVVVTPSAFAASFQRLVDWKTSKGIRARVVTTEFIEECYAGGDQAASIRLFLRDAYKTWGIKYALLGGDVEYLACRIVKTKVKDYEEMPADIYFACLNGGWDGDSDGTYGEVTDGVDLEPEIYVGRASVRSPEEAGVFVDKVLRYEKEPVEGLGGRNLWIGANLDSNTFGKDVCQKIITETKVPEQISNKLLSTVDENLTLETMTSAIENYSPNFMFVAAHGGDSLIAIDSGTMKSEHADELTNFPFIYVATCCLTNKFDEDCITEHMMRNPSGGAVAAWACSRYGWYNPGMAGYGSSDLVTKDMFDLLYRRYLTEPPALGELIHRAKRKFISESQDDGVYRWLTYGMNLLGCPEMPIWTGQQQEVEVDVKANGEFAEQGIDVNVRNELGPVENAFVTVWRASTDSPVVVTVWGLNIKPKVVKTEILSDEEGELFVSGRTSSNGLVRLELSKSPETAAMQVEDLLVLSRSLSTLKTHLEGVGKEDRKRLERLMRDYEHTEFRIEEKRKNLLAFFKEQARKKEWDVAEEALDLVFKKLNGPSGDTQSLAFVLNSLSKVLSFDWSALSSENSPQGRVFRKLLRLKKQVGHMVYADPSSNEHGRITITSHPEGAKVLVDSIPVGTTPCTMSTKQGQHIVSVLAAGAAIGSQAVDVMPGETANCHFELESLRSFTGRVTLYGAQNNEGAEVALYYNKEGKFVLLKSFKTKADGTFSFQALPGKALYVKVTCKGYNNEGNWLIFDNPHIPAQQKKNYKLFPLAHIAGKVTLIGDNPIKIRLYSLEEHKPKFVAEKSISSDSQYSFDELPVGLYFVVTVGLGMTAQRQWIDLKNGDPADNINLVAAPIKTAHIGHYIGGDKKWQFAQMEKGDDGLFRGLYPAPPSERKYYFLLMLNKDQEGQCFVMDPNNFPANGPSDCSSILIEEEEAEITFDPTLTPTYVKKTAE